jgi:hypothetical protein
MVCLVFDSFFTISDSAGRPWSQMWFYESASSVLRTWSVWFQIRFSKFPIQLVLLVSDSAGFPGFRFVCDSGFRFSLCWFPNMVCLVSDSFFSVSDSAVGPGFRFGWFSWFPIQLRFGFPIRPLLVSEHGLSGFRFVFGSFRFGWWSWFPIRFGFRFLIRRSGFRFSFIPMSRQLNQKPKKPQSETRQSRIRNHQHFESETTNNSNQKPRNAESETMKRGIRNQAFRIRNPETRNQKPKNAESETKKRGIRNQETNQKPSKCFLRNPRDAESETKSASNQKETNSQLQIEHATKGNRSKS